MLPSCLRSHWRPLTRASALMCFLIATVALFQTNVIPTVQRGFFCDDQTIRYPYHYSTFPTWLLVVVFMVVPDLIVAGVEFCYARNYANLFYCLGHFKLSISMSTILTDVVKCVVGRLRPHFIAVCGPDVLLNMTCDAETSLLYILEYNCTNPLHLDPDVIVEAHKSFPSGHASLAMCSAVFVTLYVWRRAPSQPPHLGRLFLVFLILVGAGAVCGSRVMDYKHHGEDVAFGFVIGSVVAFTSGYVWWGAMESLRFEDDDDSDKSGAGDSNNVTNIVERKPLTEYRV